MRPRDPRPACQPAARPSKMAAGTWIAPARPIHAGMWMPDQCAMPRTPAPSRRAVLGGLAGAALLGGCDTGGGGTTLRWWSPQAAPDQVARYRQQIARFEAAHPGITVRFEPTSDEGYPAQLAAAFASGQVPNIVTHLPSFAAQGYYARGLLEPMDDVVRAIGPDRYFPHANDVYRAADGKLCATAFGNTAVDMLWLRRDLMAAAGIGAVPRTWDELRAACRAMQKGGVYGAPLPFGSNAMTSLIFIGFIHRAGGQVFAPDLAVAIDSPATYAALDFYRSMHELCPPGATSFGWADSLNAFTSGATATGIYGGRVLGNIARQNPRMAGQLVCATYPTMTAAIAPWTFNDFPSVIIPKRAANLAATKMFAASLFDPAGYIPTLLAAPGHILPPLKPIAENPSYQADPVIAANRPAVALMTESAAAGHNLGFESPAHKPNPRAGEIIASNVIAEMVQKVVLQGANPKAAVGDTAKRLAELMAA